MQISTRSEWRSQILLLQYVGFAELQAWSAERQDARHGIAVNSSNSLTLNDSHPSTRQGLLPCGTHALSHSYAGIRKKACTDRSLTHGDALMRHPPRLRWLLPLSAVPSGGFTKLGLANVRSSRDSPPRSGREAAPADAQRLRASMCGDGQRGARGAAGPRPPWAAWLPAAAKQRAAL